MLRLLGCLLFGYAALAVQLSGIFGPLGDAAPAVAVIIAGRFLAPPLAGGFAFLNGIGADAIGSGTLGVHAATLLLLSAWQTRMWAGGKRVSVWHWALVVAMAVCWDGLAPVFIATLPNPDWSRLEDQAMQVGISAVVAALSVALCVSLTRLAFSRPSINREFA